MTFEDVATKEDFRKLKWSVIRWLTASWATAMFIITMAILLFLPGCGMFQPVQQLAVPTNLSEAGREAAKIINEAKVDLIAANNTITTQLKAGLMTKADAQSLAAKVDEYWGKVKQAETLLGSGQDLLAKQQAQLLSTLLVELQKQVVARSKK